MKKRIREAVKKLEAAGFEVVDVQVTGGDHYKYRLRKGRETRIMFASNSPSCNYAVAQMVRTAKKLFQNTKQLERT